MTNEDDGILFQYLNSTGHVCIIRKTHTSAVAYIRRGMNVPKQTLSEIMDVEYTSFLLAPVGVVTVAVDTDMLESRVCWKPFLGPEVGSVI